MDFLQVYFLFGKSENLQGKNFVKTAFCLTQCPYN